MNLFVPKKAVNLTFKRMKILSAATAVAIVIIVAFQNTESVETRILVATITMPRSLLIFIAVLSGFFFGLLTAARMARPKKAN